jgi:GTPase SAR1 family protein
VPGDEKFMALNRMYLRDTNAALIVYDVTNPESLKQAEKWVTELKEYAPSEIVLACCGTHLDIPGLHAVSQQDGQGFSRKHGMAVCMEVSSRTKEGID